MRRIFKVIVRFRSLFCTRLPIAINSINIIAHYLICQNTCTTIIILKYVAHFIFPLRIEYSSVVFVTFLRSIFNRSTFPIHLYGSKSV